MSSSQYEDYSEFAAAVEAHCCDTLEGFVLRWPLLSDSIKEFPDFAAAVVVHGLKANKKFNLRFGASPLEIRRRFLQENRRSVAAYHFEKSLKAQATEMNPIQHISGMQQHNGNVANIQLHGTGTVEVKDGDYSTFQSWNNGSRELGLRTASWNAPTSDLRPQHLAQANNNVTHGGSLDSRSHSQLQNNLLPQGTASPNLAMGTNSTTTATTTSSSSRSSTYPNRALQLSSPELQAQLQAINYYIANCAAYLKEGGHPCQFHTLRLHANPTGLPENVTSWAEARAFTWYIRENNLAHAHPSLRAGQFMVMNGLASNSAGNQQTQQMQLQYNQQQQGQQQHILQQLGQYQKPRLYYPIPREQTQFPLQFQPLQDQYQNIGLVSSVYGPQFQGQLQPHQISQQEPDLFAHQQVQDLQYQQQQENDEDNLDIPSSHVQFQGDLAPGTNPPLFLDAAILPLDLLVRECSLPTASELTKSETTPEELQSFNEMLGALDGGEQGEGEAEEALGSLMTDEELEREIEGWY
ncbi:uncharacterized protein BP5553_05465 [Venustampulla echinocandica]|uniref:Uncharacterized protein n=1 Tax=Venustampulla echinocandica TaxID=2656787 RepID=A0A370TR78_9HELO|nr:uncharacterized protein BP5553_05465 [Venustampulla echinocandica]RDL38032.1 hypothetical protein BP5553_05465 [Venustampulla echinocandica]